jgi:hypothetical protein
MAFERMAFRWRALKLNASFVVGDYGAALADTCLAASNLYPAFVCFFLSVIYESCATTTNSV